MFFYGLRPGREVSVELDRGLTLVIRCLAIGETDEEGSVRVFYELNGQPRAVKVENREATASVVRRPKADPDDPRHVAARCREWWRRWRSRRGGRWSPAIC